MTPSRASAPVQQDVSPPAGPLVRLHDARETVVAGVEGAAIAVRTLDGVTLHVHPGELLVVRGSPADGTAALARALAGDRRLRRDPPAGERVVLPGTRVRRGAIAPRAAASLIRGWRLADGAERVADAGAGAHDGEDRDGAERRARTVYLLRVRGDVAIGSAGHADGALAWRAWAALVRREGSAVVLLEQGPGEGATSGPATHAASAASVVREGVASTGESNADAGAGPDDGGGVRVVTLVAGRLADRERPGRPGHRGEQRPSARGRRRA